MTTLRFYNTLSRQKEDFVPIKPDSVGLYSCGPTVYDHVHIGNLRAFIVADTLQRVLRQVGKYDVTWVMNITDIDDKMIERAGQRFPEDEPRAALDKLAEEYMTKFQVDLKRVGIRPVDFAKQPRATEHITGMQDDIRRLVSEGVAYVSEGSIYFSLQKYESTGKKYGQLVDVHYDSQSRIDDQDQKQGAGDFALWKAAHAGEPSWDFDIDGVSLPGRPGWHIECTTMSTQYLGEHFDIHTGGIDLRFPHHENEIAQNHGQLANYWLHNEFLQVDTEKMSKRLNNFRTITDIENPLAFRLLVLSSHYRSPMDFSLESLTAAENRLRALREYASRLVNNPLSDEASDQLESINQRITTVLADDLNTPEALAVLAEHTPVLSTASRNFLQHIDTIFGLQLFEDQPDLRADTSVTQLLESREEVRQARDFERSDKLRDALHKLGVGVEDTPSGQIIWQLA